MKENLWDRLLRQRHSFALPSADLHEAVEEARERLAAEEEFSERDREWLREMKVLA